MSLLLLLQAQAAGGAALNQTLGAATVSAQGTLTDTGSLSTTLGSATISAQGALPIAASLSQTLGTATLAATGTSNAPIAQPQPTNTGGYLWTPAAERELAQLVRRRKQREDDERAIEAALEAAGAAQAAAEASAQADELRRLAGLVDAYARSTSDDLLLRRTARAIEYAQRAQSALAYELALREIARQLEEEEFAVLMALAIAA